MTRERPWPNEKIAFAQKVERERAAISDLGRRMESDGARPRDLAMIAKTQGPPSEELLALQERIALFGQGQSC